MASEIGKPNWLTIPGSSAYWVPCPGWRSAKRSIFAPRSFKSGNSVAVRYPGGYQELEAGMEMDFDRGEHGRNILSLEPVDRPKPKLRSI